MGAKKITDQQVVSLRKEYLAGDSPDCLSERYGISKSHVQSICRGKDRSSIGGPITQSKPVGKHGNHAKGSNHYRWNSGQILSQEGYPKIKIGITHPLADPNGYAYEHILVWISAGNSLEKGEILHHINGDRLDNRLQNLEKMTRAQHNVVHHGTTKLPGSDAIAHNAGAR